MYNRNSITILIACGYISIYWSQRIYLEFKGNVKYNINYSKHSLWHWLYSDLTFTLLPEFISLFLASFSHCFLHVLWASFNFEKGLRSVLLGPGFGLFLGVFFLSIWAICWFRSTIIIWRKRDSWRERQKRSERGGMTGREIERWRIVCLDHSLNKHGQHHHHH